MRRLSCMSPAVLAIFVAGAVLPRAALVVHQHAGGDHAHLHAEDELAAEHVHEHDHPHHHDVADGSQGASLEEPEAADAWHVHWQHPFQRADRPPLPTLEQSEAVVRLAARCPANPPAPARAPTRSRGPPSLASS